jgi:hypothetical protein
VQNVASWACSSWEQQLDNNLHHVDGYSYFSAGVFLNEQGGFEYGL